MATFKAVTRKMRADGLYPVYIRVCHRTQKGYINTGKLVSQKKVKKDGEITDTFVLEYCAREINRFTEQSNRKDISKMTLSELIQYLTEENSDPCFSDYAREYINKMINSNHERNAKNYKAALKSLELSFGSNRILFSQLTSTVLRKWIETMKMTSRCKEQYPICMRQVFKSALLELNDEERGVIPIKFNPWLKVTIPKADQGEKRAITAEACREFFNRPLPKTKMLSSLPELARDVCLLSLCLGGMNTADIYNLRKTDYQNGIIGYKRAKTKHARKDEAYIEMRVEPFIKNTFNKYLSDKEDPFLFTFHNRYKDIDSFNANVNNGIKKICKDMDMDEKDYYCFYTFRHTWATIAQNDCEATIAEVAFGMNHSHGFAVTRGYIKPDFTPAWDLNAKVIEFIFFTDKPSKQGRAKDIEAPAGKLFRLSPKMMVYARAYYKGKVIGEVTDIGFNTIQKVIDRLVPSFPDDIPEGGAVHFRIQNLDSGMEEVYERTKGKGF